MSGPTIAPEIATGSNAQDKADQLKIIHQAVIGAKEGAAEAISMKVGTNISDSHLRRHVTPLPRQQSVRSTFHQTSTQVDARSIWLPS